MTRFLLSFFLALPLWAGAQDSTSCSHLVNDVNGDLSVGATDLLELLSAFGSDYDLDDDGVPDCMDDCMGVKDICGVCNGQGPQVLAIDTIITAMDTVYVPETGQWTVQAQVDTVLHLVCENPGCTDPAALNFDPYASPGMSCSYPAEGCGEDVTYFGYDYATVQIGEQCWFAENLRTTVYADGSPITPYSPSVGWWLTEEGITAVYGFGPPYETYPCEDSSPDIHACDPVQAENEYGRLYTWRAVADARGLCPAGWHVSTDADWTVLEDEIGSWGYDGHEGTALKAGSGWHEGFNGSDAAGFGALPAGFLFPSGIGEFRHAGREGRWWTADEESADRAKVRRIEFGSSALHGGHKWKHFGHSVRCVKSDEATGCTDPEYLEYDPEATVDDGSCETLSIPGCTDPDYEQFDPEANVDDGSCLTLIVPGCTDPDYEEYDPLATEDDGSCTELIPAFSCGDDVDHFGYEYATVRIGSQCWFAENLRSKFYTDGSELIMDLHDAGWVMATEGAATIYGENGAFCTESSPDFDACDGESAFSTYGRLYNGYAVRDERGLCPVGWRVGTDGDWTMLTDYIATEVPPGYEGKALKASGGWSAGTNGSDDYGFKGLPSGYRYFGTGAYSNAGTFGYFWAHRVDTDSLFYRRLSTNADDVHRGVLSNGSAMGAAVRCVRSAALAGCTDPDYAEYDPDATVDDGSCETPLAPEGCVDVTFDGYEYATVQIGDQCWFAENLRTTVYADGSAITVGLTAPPGDDDLPVEVEAATGVYAEPGRGCSHSHAELDACDADVALAEFGRLYNWYAVEDERGLCPDGWHVPTRNDWLSLEGELDDMGYETGTALKSTTGWAGDGNGTNSVGFDGRPAGGLSDGLGYYSGAGLEAVWWSSTPYSQGRSYVEELTASSTTSSAEHNAIAYYGKSVRCLKTPDVLGCTNPEYVEYDPEANVDDGSCLTHIVPVSCGDVTFDGYDYETVQIGYQCWFAENLRTTVYADGSAITVGLTAPPDGLSPVEPATEVYGQFGRGCYRGWLDWEPCDEDLALAEFGRLYNWYAVDDDRGLCPEGWQIPSEDDWDILQWKVESLELEPGTALKSASGWYSGWHQDGSGTNIMGFNGRPAGAINQDGHYAVAGVEAQWWSSTTEPVSSSFTKGLKASDSSMTEGPSKRHHGHSVRCMKIIDVFGCMDPAYIEYNPDANVDDGSCLTPVPLDCPDVTFDGYTYSSQEMGGRCWFVENLRTTVYANGNAIPSGLDDIAWSDTTNGASAVFGEGVSDCDPLDDDGVDNCDEAFALETYGRLYNGHAVKDERGLCPTGWRVSNSADWADLLDDVAEAGFDGATEAVPLKATTGWAMDNNGTDLFGFAGLPGGMRLPGGEFVFAGGMGTWWSSTLSASSFGPDSDSPFFQFPLESQGTLTNWLSDSFGMSVRCVMED